MKRIILAALCLSVSIVTLSQSLAVNTDGSTADGSALLDIKSTLKGVLIPRMTKAEKNAITTPATGLLLYQTGPDSTGFYFYNGTQWNWLSTASTQQGWLTTGNAGTTASNNFLGTTDNIPLSFRQNNNWIGRMDASTRNYYIGGGAGALASGNTNVAMGDSALNAGSASQAIIIGAQAGKINNSGGSIAIGYQAASNNTAPGVAIGYQSQRFFGSATNTSLGSFTLAAGGGSSGLNTAVGYNSLATSFSGTSNTTLGANAANGIDSGSHNIAIGAYALFGNSVSRDTAFFNIAIGNFSQANGRNVRSNTSLGNYSLNFNFTGNNNTAVGDSAMLFSNSGNENTMMGKRAGVSAYFGSRNVLIGAYTGSQNLVGYNYNDNTFVGYRAGGSNANGNQNTFFGDSCGYININGSGNTAHGTLAGPSISSLTNATAIGFRAQVSQNNSLILGSINGVNGSTADTRVGIGTTAPNTNSLFSVSNNFMVQPSGTLQYANSVNNMMYMFESGFSNADRMLIAHSPAFTNYGIQYQDASDKLNFLSSGNPVMTIELGSTNNVGINNNNPNSTLQVNGSFSVSTSMSVAGGSIGTPASLAGLNGYIGLSPVGANDYYELPDPATCPGRIYYIRNNNNPGDDDAFVRSGGAGQVCSGSGGCLGAGNYYTITTGNPNPVPKTIICLSDGVNWIIGRID